MNFRIMMKNIYGQKYLGSYSRDKQSEHSTQFINGDNLFEEVTAFVFSN